MNGSRKERKKKNNESKVKGLISRNMLPFDQRNTPLCHTHTNHVKHDWLHKVNTLIAIIVYHLNCNMAALLNSSQHISLYTYQ